MNIFQNLVEELKDENLLEKTVIETSLHEAASENPTEELAVLTLQSGVDESSNDTTQSKLEQDDELLSDELFEVGQTTAPEDDIDETAVSTQENEFALNQPDLPLPPPSQAEFYRKRAIDEVSGLQMVEHVLSGVEREQMKILPKNYDDLEVKKALHRFLQVAGESDSPEHAQVEFQLMQETESWYSALSRRDKHISVAHLRRYCETTRPVLSSQALTSLARFYRNSPFSEQVRSKFDLILTRLFTKDVGDEKRMMTFKREKLIEHIGSLYADWASIPLYSASDDDSEVLIMTLKFEDFMTEADSSDSFDELIKNDFFNRLRVFKKSTNENFFSPLVAATAIECNVRVGNRFVDLLQQEKERLNDNVLEDKYGFLHDQAISEATGKTLQLIELLNKKEVKEPVLAAAPPPVKPTTAEPKKTETKEPTHKSASSSSFSSPIKSSRRSKKELFRVNKWLLAATVLSIVLSVGIYFWANQNEVTPRPSVTKVNLENSFLKEYLKEAKINGNTFLGSVQPSWKGLDKQKKEEVLKKLYDVGGEKGYAKVHLLFEDGTTAGFAVEHKLEAF
jgi:hypothetical protein